MWQPGNINSATATFSTAGTKTITVTDINGCVSSTPVVIGANPLPSINISGGLAPVCSGDYTTLTASSIGGTSFVWEPGTYLTATATFTTPGTKTVTVSDASGCINTATVTIVVTPLPIVTISAGDTICSGQAVTLTASGAATYQWDFTGNTSPVVSTTLTANTVFNVVGTDANGCTGTAQKTVAVNNCLLSMDETRSQERINLYPNPCKDLFTIELPKESILSISNAFGEIILNKNMQEGINQINLAEFANGIYLLAVNTPKGQQTIRVVKQP